MASRFIGRDYSTLRSEIIDFLRLRLPKSWDYMNLSDPVVVFAESLARIGDQLHFTIDELRRECDIATAKRASSIYSYAMREGYKMQLPKAAYGTIGVNTTKEQDGLLHLTLKQFDEIKVNPLGESLFVVNQDDIDTDLHSPIDSSYFKSLKQYEVDASDSSSTVNNKRKQAMSLYQAYYEDVYNRTQHVKVVLGTKGEFPFTYNDINNDSTIELPNPLIDRDLVRLSYANSKTGTDVNGLPKYEQLQYVDDVISSGFVFKSFTLTPKFIGGAVTLCIEFPTNYRDIFNNDVSTVFKFEYINIKDSKINPLSEYQDNADAISFPDGAITVVSGHDEDKEIIDNGIQYRVNLGDGIKGYTEYENALVTRDNYKKYVQNYSALLTKSDYTNYINALTHTYCKVYDHGDMYKKPAILPADASLIPRAVYIITDANYSGREILWNDLKERSSRSDCIMLMPYGKDPYSIIIKAECYLVGTSISAIATQIEQALVMYYSGYTGEKIPKISMINHLTHKASDKVLRMEGLIVRDSTYGTIDTTFNSVNQLDNDQIDLLYDSFKNESVSYISPIVDDEKTAEDSSEDYRYWLRGYKYEDKDGNFYTEESLAKKNQELSSDKQINQVVKHYYAKYPRLTYKEYIDDAHMSEDIVAEEYRDYPESFPKIYYINQLNEEIVIDEYSDLIDHQIGYGELDSESWDISDTSIYSAKDSFDRTKYLSFNYAKIDDPLVTAKITLDISDTTFWDTTESGPIKIRSYKESDGSATGITVQIKYSEDESAENVTFTFDSIISYYKNPNNPSEILPPDDQRICDNPIPVTASDNIRPVIDPYYKKHHYVVPVLNKVIVLIKSVNNNI